MAENVKGKAVVEILRSSAVVQAFADSTNPIDIQVIDNLGFLTQPDKHAINNAYKELGPTTGGARLRDCLIHRYNDRPELDLQQFIIGLDNIGHEQLKKLLLSVCESSQGLVAPSARNIFTDLVTKLMKCYVDEFSFFKPLSFDEITFNLDEIWINLQLENLSDRAATPIYGCIDCLNIAFRERKVVICKGEAGTGKSTLSAYLCHKWAKSKWKDCPFDLVFLVPIRELVGHEMKTIIEAVLNVAKSYAMLSDQLNTLKQMFKLGYKCMIIIDGYDEGTEVCEQLRSVLLNEIKGLPFHILLTSRPWALASIKCAAQVVKICPLTDAQQTEYIANVFRFIGKEYFGKTLIEELENNPILKKLSETPLILCYLCFYYTNYKTVPTGINSLTSVCFHMIACLIDRYQTDKLPSSAEKPFEQNWLQSKIMLNLGKMAFFGLTTSPIIFADSFVAKFNVDIKTCVSVGLLVHSKHRLPALAPQCTYAFPHLVMQEFSASLFVLWCYLTIEDKTERSVQLTGGPEAPNNFWLSPFHACNVFSMILDFANDSNLADAAIDALTDLPTVCQIHYLFFWYSANALEIVKLIHNITNQSLKSRVHDFIHGLVVTILELYYTEKFSDKIFLEFCRPKDLPLYRVQNLPNWYYNSENNAICYGDEAFKEILHHCRQVSFDDLKQPLRVIFFYSSFSVLNQLLTENFVAIDKITNHNGGYLYLSLCAPVSALTMENMNESGKNYLHVSELIMIYDKKFIDSINANELKELYDSFIQWICSLDEVTKACIKCIEPTINSVYATSFPDAQFCDNLSQNVPHLSILQLNIYYPEDFEGIITEFAECWSHFKSVTTVHLVKDLVTGEKIWDKSDHYIFELLQCAFEGIPNLTTILVEKTPNNLTLNVKSFVSLEFDDFLESVNK